MRLARIAPLLAGGLLVAARLVAANDELPSPKERWIHLDSAHFSLYSSAPEKTARRLLTRLERLRQVLSRLGSGKGLELTRPTEIFVFKNDRAFLPFEPIGPDGKPQPLSGYFVPRDDRNVIALADWPEGDPIAPILHEYLHSLIDVSFRRLPVWANEGLAEFYSTFDVDEDSADIGRPVHEHVLASREVKRMPAQRLMAVAHGDPEYNERDRKAVFYAQSWLTTHFLLLGRPERRGDFGRFIDAVERGTDQTEAFVQAFGLAPADLEKELVAYTRRGYYPFLAFKFDELPALDPFALRDVSYPEIVARLADLSRRVDVAYGTRATLWLEAAAKLDPASPVVAEALALDREEAGRTADAIALLRTALERSPDYEPAQALLGRLLVSLPGEPDAVVAEEARRWLRRSLESEPGRLDSWIALGRAELAPGGDPKGAIAALERAWRLAPDRTDLLANYILAIADDAQYARAAAVARATLAKSPRPADQALARQQLRYIAEREIVELANAGRSEDALLRIAAWTAVSSDPETTAMLDRYRGLLEGQAAARTCNELLNAGIESANAQKTAEAKAAFERVLAECHDEHVRERAQAILDQIAAFEKRRPR